MAWDSAGIRRGTVMGRISGTTFRKYLRDLICIPSPSGREEPIAMWCELELEERGFEVEIDHAGNVLAKRGEGPFVLLNAHMDTTQSKDDVREIRDGGLRRPRLDLRYGFDDKVGIAIIMTLAEIDDLPFKVLLTVGEEVGGIGVKEISCESYEDVICCLTLDRGNAREMVTSINGINLATDGWLDVIDRAFRRGGFPFDRVGGRGSDARAISKYVPTVNLSVGIHEMHTPYEFVKIDEALWTAKAVLHLLMNRGLLEMKG